LRTPGKQEGGPADRLNEVGKNLTARKARDTRESQRATRRPEQRRSWGGRKGNVKNEKKQESRPERLKQCKPLNRHGQENSATGGLNQKRSELTGNSHGWGRSWSMPIHGGQKDGGGIIGEKWRTGQHEGCLGHSKTGQNLEKPITERHEDGSQNPAKKGKGVGGGGIEKAQICKMEFQGMAARGGM